jgi:biotin carboxyl carrier protein
MAEFCFEVGGKQYRLQLEASADGYRATIGEQTYLVQGHFRADGQLDLLVDGQRQRVYTARSADQPNRQVLWLAGQTWTVTAVDPRVRRQDQAVQQTEGTVNATVPGQVRAIQVAVGDTVSAGDPLLMLEAMKMEMRILAPKGGTVGKINCAVGDVVERGQWLVEIEG